MKISLELDQQWATVTELQDYLRLLTRTMERIYEMEADAPTDWFVFVELINSEYKISLTHL